MAAITNTKPSLPPNTGKSLGNFEQDISRAIMGSYTSHPKPAKLFETMPPAPPPSPVSFAIDSYSNGKTMTSKHEKISGLCLE
ncbi:hypothetical protein N7532_003360 [Penicillium argentinense]|uniref:Uncharacterized protein n=1 Tax=Penicillium argentinense TaxID=1131581 RepID=A0A9W9FM91_9EURO|nr:uncharacterized protein N7532_003360 [Penicillium argentinense]KAJ5102831.1 hypothetical protein N7532_003360 [Penicillium argentinense]